jgi:hypothetical protein
MMVLYGDWQQLYATVRCYTAGGRTIISSASKAGCLWVNKCTVFVVISNVISTPIFAVRNRLTFLMVSLNAFKEKGGFL